MKIILAGFLFLLCMPLQAHEFGKLVLAGSGCFGGSKMAAIEGEQSRFALPVRVRLNKKSGTAFERKACTMRLPVSLAQNERLQILNLSQTVKVIADRDMEVKSALSFSLLGQKATPLLYSVKATEGSLSVIENIKADGLVAESECGKSAMITGDLNIIAAGNGKALATTGTALVTLKIIPCN